MDFIGQKVNHKSYGEGTIVLITDKYFKIEFPEGVITLQYPQAVEKFINAIDVDVQKALTEKIKIDKADAEEAKRVVLEKKEKEDKYLREARNATNAKSSYKAKKRDENSKMIFLVFQKDAMFEKQAQGGYIWAPCFDTTGNIVHHWERLTEVRANDVILHCSGGEICAISVAKGSCYDCLQPKELRGDDLWGVDGRMVDCEYVLVKKPICTSNYKAEIIQKSTAKYSPFNVNGTGNQGYLYDLNKELAVLFIIELVKANKSLLDYDFIKEIVGE